ncbi:MAG: 30S ribosomal protein S1 [Candidatus Brocadiae bacterium]|nr:30S ribosomal protein S1 [Candidatus Brocadiia bacterium]
MAKRNILADYGIESDEIEKEVQESLQGLSGEELEKSLDESVKDYHVNTILEGRVVSLTSGEVMVDVGYKSEGAVPRNEWDDAHAVAVGDTVEVLLEAVEDDAGLVQLSKRKADRIRNWERVVTHYDEGDIVTGTVMRKIKGGLLVDIGVPVFLPASQVDIRRPGEIADFIGTRLTCKILKIDEQRRNIVVSRRQLIEGQRQIMKVRILEKLEKGQTRTGKVKNIVDFGAFVDLGGIDGLLHITDMSWGRISHPSEMVAIDDLIEVMILNVDIEKEKVALGLKQKTPSPWDGIEEKYPVGSVVAGEVVNLMSYGAFVKIEEGVEGLVHISEMSWTRRINHPSEVVAIGDVVDVMVLGINKEKEEISLGIKQTEQNPWEMVQKNYPSGTEVVGRVRNLTSYGAFIEIEEGIDGLLHVSDMSWTRKVSHPSEVVQKGDTIKTVVLEVDPEKRRVALGLKQLEADPWKEDIPSRYRTGDMVRGIVTKLTSFGAFVELEDGLEGLLHISELSEKKIPSPEEVVDVGDVLDVRIIRLDVQDRKIGLSLRFEPALAQADQVPRIVIRSDELEEAEHPEELVKEAMQEAPQLERERPASQTASAEGAESTLDIPVGEVVREEAPEEKEAEDTERPASPEEPAAEQTAQLEEEAPEGESSPAEPEAPMEDEVGEASTDPDEDGEASTDLDVGASPEGEATEEAPGSDSGPEDSE